MPSSMFSPRQEIGSPSLRKGLEKMIRARVPSSEVDDIIQSTLADALASQSVPDDPEEIRRWVFGIARHKIADHFRRNGRERPVAQPELHAPSAPHAAEDLLRWVDREMPPDSQGQETLDWMLREGEGEKLEHIAEQDNVPAPRVRQRVNRWRKQLRERWAAQLAAVAAIVVIVGAALWAWRHRTQQAVTVGPDHSAVTPVESARLRAAELRSAALQRCESKEWVACLQGLDEAAKLDPAGDRSDEVARARQGAADAMRSPAPSPSSSAAPEDSAVPMKVPNKVAPVPTESFPSPKTTDNKEAPYKGEVKKADSTNSPKDATNSLVPEPQQQQPRVTDPDSVSKDGTYPKQKAYRGKADKKPQSIDDFSRK